MKEMLIQSHTIASMTEANQNFTKVARLADKYGEAIIFKNNRPKYKLVDPDHADDPELTDDEKIDIVAGRLLNEYRPAFEELAK